MNGLETKLASYVLGRQVEHDATKWAAQVLAAVKHHGLVLIDPDDDAEVFRLLDSLACQDWAVDDDSSPGDMRAALRKFARPEPVTVFEHYVSSWSSDGHTERREVAQSVCGKLWKPYGLTESAGKCPVCVEIVESGWHK